jgi:hypothetical protein
MQDTVCLPYSTCDSQWPSVRLDSSDSLREPLAIQKGKENTECFHGLLHSSPLLKRNAPPGAFTRISTYTKIYNNTRFMNIIFHMTYYCTIIQVHIDAKSFINIILSHQCFKIHQHITSMLHHSSTYHIDATLFTNISMQHH